MTTTRVRPDAGWVGVSKERGPNGRGVCRRCGVEVPKGRRTFCSEDCVREWRITSDPAYASGQVFLRDHGVCCRCGRDMEAAKRELDLLMRGTSDRHGGDVWHNYYLRNFFNVVRPPDPTVGDGWSNPDRWWEAHHKVAVVEGGGACGLDGFETLCYRCHRVETADLRKRLAKRPTPSTGPTGRQGTRSG